MERLIEMNRSLILSPDVEPQRFRPLMQNVGDTPGMGGVKLGFEVGLGLGLRPAANIVRESNPHLKIIYDHQKAGNDIPDTGMNFARAMRAADVDAAILFPFTGPQTLKQWVLELYEQRIGVILGAEMTHKQIRASEGGFILDAAFKKMFSQAIDLKVTNFVVPGNKPDKVKVYKEFFDKEIGEGEYSLWAPGFVTQGGDVSETGLVAGPNFHAIVGSGIYNAKNQTVAARILGQKMIELNQPEEEQTAQLVEE